VGYGDSLTFIGSKTGIEVIYNDDSTGRYEPKAWAYFVEFPTQAACILFLNGITQRDIGDLVDLGFERVL